MTEANIAGWCKAHFKTTDYKLKTLIGTDAIL